MQQLSQQMKHRLLARYVATMKQQPIAVVDYLLGHVVILSARLPLSVRYQIGNALRDCADVVEREAEEPRRVVQ
jgi:hypothetical protein